MKTFKFNLIILMMFILLTSFGFGKIIDNNSKTIFQNCLIFRYDGKVFIIGYDHNNKRIVDGLESYDAMIYKLQGNEFIPSSKPFGITNDETTTDGFYLYKYHSYDKNNNQQFGGGSSSVEVLDDGYVLLTFLNVDRYNGNKSNILLLKYNNSDNWDIIKHYKFNSKYPLLIEQYYFNLNNKDRSLMIYSNMGDVRVDLVKDKDGYNFNLIKGKIINL